jgi:superfamily I DNA and/or RNA helicase
VLHYYLNLPKDNKLDFEKNMNLSYAIMETAKNSFEPFEAYLDNAKKAMELKEKIEAKWEKVKTENSAELKIKGGLYEIPKRTVIQVSENKKGWYRIVSSIDEPDFRENLKYKAGNEKGEIPVSEEDVQKGVIKLPVETEKFDKVLWGFNDIVLEPAWAKFIKGEKISDYVILSINSDEIEIKGIVKPHEKLLYKDKEISYTVKSKTQAPTGCIIREDPDRYIVYREKNEKQSDTALRIPDHKLAGIIGVDKLFFEDGTNFEFERNEGLTITVRNSRDYSKTVVSNNIKFTVEHILKKNRDAWWIQLLELDGTAAHEEVHGLSPLRYFFDDEVSVIDDKKNEYLIVAGIESENKLVLKQKNGKEYGNFCFPEGEILSVKINTYQLKKQLESVSTLKNMPVGEQAKLIRLFENKEKTRWEIPGSQPVQEWYVITDQTRSGYKEQRAFVEQALNTPDFAILEGPPGSGKTTVILELLCQLAKQGKRVLLCGSTHVAIDNILERLKEKKQETESLLERLHILPVRIGDEKRINEDIREFQIDNLIADNGIDQNLLLDAANLVCGTTIGILQHPRFKERNKNSWIEPIVPFFDCLIIDESSKTTFQEFLVPALYAKKWILAGDVMQLSPFTERENIVSNIEGLSINGKRLDTDLQQAIFYLQKLKECMCNKDNRNNRFVLPVPKEIINQMLSELDHGRNIDFMKNNKLLFFITDLAGTGDYDENIQIRTFKEINGLELSGADVIFIEEIRLHTVIEAIPERHAVLRFESWFETEHAFRHNVYQKKHPFFIIEKGKKFADSFEITVRINSYFEKNWAEEVAWRIDREHQLRLKEKNKTKERLTAAIEGFIPQSLDREKVENALNSVAAMAFPSILESLSQGIKGRKSKIASTISEGFKKEDLENRKTILVYQHRMHPDISRFPRERFYHTEALLDLADPCPIEYTRQWQYDYYQNRSVWVDVKDGETVRNYNMKEVHVLIEELKRFLRYAKEHGQPEGKTWTVACLTFYRGQETKIREELQKLTGNENGVSNFNIKDGTHKINIKLHTVDKFQGHEADIVFLSMVQTKRVGFMDNPNRLNVAITRAKFQLVIIGSHDYFAGQNVSDDLQELAKNTSIARRQK